MDYDTISFDDGPTTLTLNDFDLNMEKISPFEKEEDAPEGGEDAPIRFDYSVPVDPADPSKGIESIAEEWSPDHAKLLYLMSKYAVCARTAREQEGWIRQLPLLVILYEAITHRILDFDYAPASMLVALNGRSRRIWMNITQEGKASVDDLREKELINGLKLSTEDFQPVTAYQVSLRGLEFLKQIPKSLKDEVDEVIYPPGRAKRFPLIVSFETIKEENQVGQFVLQSGGYRRVSSVTDSEDVSYVSSPYLPACIRNPMNQKPFSTNEHRAGESAAGISNIRDDLDEAIVLSNVIALVGEWIPFGSNQIVALNERLGSLDRCQEGLFSSMVDNNPTETNFAVPPGLTKVSVVDFDQVHYINFMAEIFFPEEEGIVQIENFGIHLNVDGTVLYGIKVESIMDRKQDHVSLDQLSRLLVDVHQDSSAIMNDLLSHYQRRLLDMVFTGDKDNRGKYNMIMAENIEPFLPALEYMDREDNENELKQVLGDLHDVFDIGEHGLLVIGRDGLLCAGANFREFEPLIAAYLSLLCREMFIRNFFVRTFVLDDSLKQTRQLILDYQKDPHNIQRIRILLNDGSKDIILLKEILLYLEESLVGAKTPPKPDSPDGACLWEKLSLNSLHHDIVLRCQDLKKLVLGAEHELLTLHQMSDVINTKQLEDVFKNIEVNTKSLVDASAANERSSASLEVMQVILAGSFAFDIVDRVSGGTLNIDVPEWVYSSLVETVIQVPFLWFLLNIVWLVAVSYGLIKLMRFLGRRADGALTYRCKINRVVDPNAMREFISSKRLEQSDCVSDRQTDIAKATWIETDLIKWKGDAPKIELVMDQKHGFLLRVVFQINSRQSVATEEELLDLLFAELTEFKVFAEVNEAVEEKAKGE